MKPKTETVRMVFARNVKNYRTILHYSQEKLAEKSSLSVQTIKDIEGCRRWVSDNTLTKLAKALKIAEFQLLLPEKYTSEQKYLPSTLKTLIKLKKSIKTYMDTQFESALNDLHG
ncbi:MAG: helix-turn-helix domain-containing protein [Treponema sp.]|jgi:transcriptional regulator with XRE-family HTH domain|nr:helix-turn-helix domain-containing protein [Treponema sp.]